MSDATLLAVEQLDPKPQVSDTDVRAVRLLLERLAADLGRRGSALGLPTAQVEILHFLVDADHRKWSTNDVAVSLEVSVLIAWREVASLVRKDLVSLGWGDRDQCSRPLVIAAAGRELAMLDPARVFERAVKSLPGADRAELRRLLEETIRAAGKPR